MRAILFTAVLLLLAAVPAFAWDGPALWQEATNQDFGGGGVWATGGKQDFGINCTHCHAGGKRFEHEESHVVVADELKSGQTSCSSCHTPAHPPQPTKRVGAGRTG